MKRSEARTTWALDGRDLSPAGEAASVRLRRLADLTRDLRGARDESGVWEVAGYHAGQLCGMEKGWVLDPRGRVLLGPTPSAPERSLWPDRTPGPDLSPPESGAAEGAGAPVTSDDPHTPSPQTEFRRVRAGAALWVPVYAGRQWLGTLVLGGPQDRRDPDPEDLTTLDVLGAQVGAAAQLLRLAAELTRSSRQARHRRLEGLRPQADRPGPRSAQGGALLTVREREVLTLVARGLSNPEIGAALGIRVGTAKIHVERILSKLGMADRMGVAMLGLSLGLIES